MLGSNVENSVVLVGLELVLLAGASTKKLEGGAPPSDAAPAPAVVFCMVYNL